VFIAIFGCEKCRAYLEHKGFEIHDDYLDIIFEGIKRSVTQKIQIKISDSECYNMKVKRLKVTVRKMYSKRKYGQHNQGDLKRLSKELLAVEKKAQKTFLRSVLQNECTCCTEFHKYINDIMETETTFRRSSPIIARSLHIQQKRPNPSTLIGRLYSVANVIIGKFNQQNQANRSTLVLTF